MTNRSVIASLVLAASLVATAGAASTVHADEQVEPTASASPQTTPTPTFTPEEPASPPPEPTETAPPATPGTSTPSELPATQSVTLEFDHPVSTEDAVALAAEQELPVISIAISNPTVVGGYGLASGVSPEEYDAWFDSQFGTLPEATGLIVDVPTEQVEDPQFELPEITTNRDELEAELSIEGSAAEELLPEPDASVEPGSGALGGGSASRSVAPADVPIGSTLDWRPGNMEYRVEQDGNRMQFSTYAAWKGGASPWKVPANYGAEFEVNLYNSYNNSGSRPNCPAGYKETFLATNYAGTWNWGVSSGQDPLPASIQAYADNNDLLDNCNKTSMAIGIRYPAGIPKNSSGFWNILVSLNAPKGNTNASRIGAGIQLVSDRACPSGNVGLTDCMGIDETAAPYPTPGYRFGLSPDRNWYAFPNLCWISGNSGIRGNPVLAIPSYSSGCFEG